MQLLIGVAVKVVIVRWAITLHNKTWRDVKKAIRLTQEKMAEEAAKKQVLT